MQGLISIFFTGTKSQTRYICKDHSNIITDLFNITNVFVMYYRLNTLIIKWIEKLNFIYIKTEMSINDAFDLKKFKHKINYNKY